MAPARRTANRHPNLAEPLRRIFHAYALMIPGTARTQLCEPRSVELGFYPAPGNPAWASHNGKICYPTLLNADLAAHAINDLPQADPVRSYACPRDGHFHHVLKARPVLEAVRAMQAIAAVTRRATHRETP